MDVKNFYKVNEEYETPTMCFFRQVICATGKEPTKGQYKVYLDWAKNDPDDFNKWYEEHKQLAPGNYVRLIKRAEEEGNIGL